LELPKVGVLEEKAAMQGVGCSQIDDVDGEEDQSDRK
jgi:hypothetical protein